MYLKSAMTPINSSKPAYTSPTDLSPHINFKLGARLVINAPNFESFISNEIVSKNNFYSTNYNEEVPGAFASSVTPQQLEPNIYMINNNIFISKSCRCSYEIQGFKFCRAGRQD